MQEKSEQDTEAFDIWTEFSAPTLDRLKLLAATLCYLVRCGTQVANILRGPLHVPPCVHLWQWSLLKFQQQPHLSITPKHALSAQHTSLRFPPFRPTALSRHSRDIVNIFQYIL